MTVDTEVKEATQAMHEATRALREANDLATKRGEETGELKERLEKAEAGIREAEDKWNALDAEKKEFEKMRGGLETRIQLMERNRSPKTSLDEEKATEVLLGRAYAKALRGGVADVRGGVIPKYRLDDDEQKAWTAFEQKSLSTDSGETGGYLMPPAQQGELIRKLIEFDALEELASSVTLTQGDTWEAPREGDQNFACDWVSERGTRGETTAGQLAMEKIVAHEIFAKPLITQKAMDDPGFNIAGWMTERLARRFRVKRGAAFVAGTGAGQPEGITVSATAIGSGAFGYVPLKHASLLNDPDGLWDVAIDLPEFYAQNATWLWRRATTGVIRKLKDGDNNYIWAPAFEGIPPTVADRPYRESINMPAIAPNAFSVALGDWASAYLVVRRQEVRLLRDPYSSKPFVEFYTTMRVGGAPVLNEAYRLGKVATS